MSDPTGIRWWPTVVTAIGSVVVAVLALLTPLIRVVPAVAVDTPVVIAGAGDIAEGGASTQANATATGDLIRSMNPNYVFTAGDNAYPDGSASDYTTKYEPTWGSFKAKTKPSPGNHEYGTAGAAGYLGYFGQAAVTDGNDPARVWYAWDAGNGWRGYALNSEVSMVTGSAQETWLAADLAAHPNMHYFAYMHQPRYVSGTVHSDRPDVCPLWNRLQTAGADLFLVGHEHLYERFAKMDCSGNAAAAGVREFVVGSGGNQLYALSSPLHTGSQASNATDFGVLKLTLHVNSYDWAFLGSGRCWSGSSSVDCPANTWLVLDSGSQATNVTLPDEPALPALPSGTRHFVANEEGAYATTAALGYNLHDTGPDPAQVNALPYADKAVVWLGEKCPTGATPAFRAAVDALANNPRVFGYYLTDEPDDVGCAADLKAEVDYIHANAPGQYTFILLTDFPGTYQAYRPAATNVDLVAVDPYPCQYPASGGCDLNRINAEVDAALAAGIPRERLVPTFQAFGQTTTWFAPSAAQLQSILDRWAALVPFPVFDFAYTWGCQGGLRTDCVSNHPDWQNVLRAYNTTFPTGRTAHAPPGNTAPAVSAGSDLTVTLPAQATLDGTVTDDGLPNPPAAVTTAWSKVSGPGAVTFGNPGAVDTSASFSAAGAYVLRLTANDSALSSADDVAVTVNSAPGGGTLDRRVAASLDDVEQFVSGNSMYVTSSDLEMVNDGSSQQLVGLRFPSVTVPQGAVISNAWVTFGAKDTASSAMTLTLRAQASDNAPAFTTANNDLGVRTMGAASVAWSPGAWTAGSPVNTSSLTALVQELVNRPGWVSGNAAVIKVSGATGARNAWSWDGQAASAPLLHVEYE